MLWEGNPYILWVNSLTGATYCGKPDKISLISIKLNQDFQNSFPSVPGVRAVRFDGVSCSGERSGGRFERNSTFCACRWRNAKYLAR
jgi:hypothetical protein